ncbi:olfactory receptor 14I1-like [Elgaria multicarinata webbii]|uniref:olfactory receptor 14I1-like n=1 Tax=Elgaria multicarinata webbii TaxID=159646 RepID=UPI002FCCEF9F
MDNQTYMSGFLLLEFSNIRELQILHFLLFLVLYLAIVSANLLIISAVKFDQRLHTPMYFFLMNLAILDIGQVSVFMPKSMANSLMNTRHISYTGCVMQVFFLIFLMGADFFLLTVMAYDRYVAICNPLHYEIVINRQACVQMVTTVWISAFFNGVLHAGGTFAAPFCSNVVDQFFCEIPRLLKLSCSKVFVIEAGTVIFSCSIVLGCFIFIFVTYVQIFTAVLRIPSVQGRQKAFATCLPHLTVILSSLFSGFFAYLWPILNTSSHADFAITIIYSVVPPMLNPVLYSMRNKEIKAALSKQLGFSYSTGSIFSSVLL